MCFNCQLFGKRIQELRLSRGMTQEILAEKASTERSHIILNNQAHESVRGTPTVSKSVDWIGIAGACGYDRTLTAETYEELEESLHTVKKSQKLTLLEVRCAIGSREDLGRPTTMPWENKIGFIEF